MFDDFVFGFGVDGDVDEGLYVVFGFVVVEVCCVVYDLVVGFELS